MNYSVFSTADLNMIYLMRGYWIDPEIGMVEFKDIREKYHLASKVLSLRSFIFEETYEPKELVVVDNINMLINQMTRTHQAMQETKRRLKGPMQEISKQIKVIAKAIRTLEKQNSKTLETRKENEKERTTELEKYQKELETLRLSIMHHKKELVHIRKDWQESKIQLKQLQNGLKITKIENLFSQKLKDIKIRINKTLKKIFWKFPEFFPNTFVSLRHSIREDLNDYPLAQKMHQRNLVKFEKQIMKKMIKVLTIEKLQEESKPELKYPRLLTDIESFKNRFKDREFDLYNTILKQFTTKTLSDLEKQIEARRKIVSFKGEFKKTCFKRYQERNRNIKRQENELAEKLNEPNEESLPLLQMERDIWNLTKTETLSERFWKEEQIMIHFLHTHWMTISSLKWESAQSDRILLSWIEIMISRHYLPEDLANRIRAYFRFPDAMSAFSLLKTSFRFLEEPIELEKKILFAHPNFIPIGSGYTDSYIEKSEGIRIYPFRVIKYNENCAALLCASGPEVGYLTAQTIEYALEGALKVLHNALSTNFDYTFQDTLKIITDLIETAHSEILLKSQSEVNLKKIFLNVSIEVEIPTFESSARKYLLNANIGSCKTFIAIPRKDCDNQIINYEVKEITDMELHNKHIGGIEDLDLDVLNITCLPLPETAYSIFTLSHELYQALDPIKLGLTPSQAAFPETTSVLSWNEEDKIKELSRIRQRRIEKSFSECLLKSISEDEKRNSLQEICETFKEVALSTMTLIEKEKKEENFSKKYLINIDHLTIAGYSFDLLESLVK